MSGNESPATQRDDQIEAKLQRVISCLSAGRCYACGWPFKEDHCQPFNCSMRYREDSQHLAEKEGWAKRMVELNDVMTWAMATSFEYLKQSPSAVAVASDEPPVIFSDGTWTWGGDGRAYDSRELDAAAWHKLKNAAPQVAREREQGGTPMTSSPAGAAPVVPSTEGRASEAYAILREMFHEYMKDDQCDSIKINTLIERGGVLVGELNEAPSSTAGIDAAVEIVRKAAEPYDTDHGDDQFIVDLLVGIADDISALKASPSATAMPSDVLAKAIEFKGRADDAGFLARAIIASSATSTKEADREES